MVRGFTVLQEGDINGEGVYCAAVMKDNQL